MSSRSLAAARARRAGENAPPVSGNRPGTSIGSHAAFAQQMPNNMGYNMPPPPNNVRVARSLPQQQPPRQAHQQPYEQPPTQQPTQPTFSKLSIGDAIGLITIRLGRVEQWILDTEQEEETRQQTNGGSSIPDNHKVIDNSVLTSIVNRLDLLEKMGAGNGTSIAADEFKQLSEDVKALSEQFKRMSDDVHKHTIELAKNTEQVFRFNRELVETKDLLKSFMVKYDIFVQDTNKNFSDYEYALSDLEKRLPVIEEETTQVDEVPVEDIDEQSNAIASEDLKSLIKKELANI